jgi:hypothetical protein
LECSILLSQCPHGIPGWQNDGFLVLKDIKDFFGAKLSVDNDLEDELLEPGSGHEQVALVVDLVTIRVLNSPLCDLATLKLKKKAFRFVYGYKHYKGLLILSSNQIL